MAETILLTGATGFLGTALASRLMQEPETTVIALVRAADEAEARHRLRAAWQHDRPLYEAIGQRVLPLPGDFTRPDIGLDEAARGKLAESVTLLIHAGAVIGFDRGWDELHRTNADGTRHMLDLARTLPRLRRFVHLSTAYVAGRREGSIPEDGSMGTGFSSRYEKSKAEAEALVRASSLPFVICRPGMIVGDSRTGWVRSFNTVYYVLRQLLLGRMRALPISRGARLSLVPVDYVADAVARLAQDPRSGGMLPLTAAESQTLRHASLPDSLYIADASILPRSLGNPPMLTIMALAKRSLPLSEPKWILFVCLMQADLRPAKVGSCQKVLVGCHF